MMLALLASTAFASTFDYEPRATRLLGSVRMALACERAQRCLGALGEVERVRAWCDAFAPGAPSDVEPPTRAAVEAVAGLDLAGPECGSQREPSRFAGAVAAARGGADGQAVGLPTSDADRGEAFAPTTPQAQRSHAVSAPAPTGFDQAELLSDLSSLLVERAGDALNDWAFHHLSSQICTDDGHLSPLLPESCALLALDGLLDDDLGVGLLQAALRKDAATMPRRIAEHRIDAPNTTPAERGDALSLAVFARTTELLLAGESPSRALGAWAHARSWRLDYEPGVASGELDPLVPVIAWSFSTAVGSLSVQDGRVVLGVGDDRAQAARQAVLACLVNLHEDGALERLVALAPGEDEAARRGATFRMLQAVVLQTWEAIERDAPLGAQIQQASLANDTEQVRRLYGRLIGQSMRDAGSSLSIAMASIASDEARAHLAGNEAMANAISAAARDLARADYAAQAQDLINLLFALRPEIRCAADDAPCQARTSLTLHTLSFLGSVAGASDATAAREAIASFAAPSGGGSRKRGANARTYAGLSAAAGLGAGPQWVLGSAGDGAGQPALGAAPVLSVGFEAWHAIGRRGWSAGLYVPVIDLGTLAAIQLGSDDDTDASKADFKHVFSPGLYGTLGLPGAPLRVGVGPSFAPGLRADGTTGEPLNALRVQAFLALDLALFP